MKFLGSEPPQCCTQTAVFTTFYRDGCEEKQNKKMLLFVW